MKFARFSLITNQPGPLAIDAVRDAISRAGGWITGHSLFSNLSATINFDLPGDATARFLELLLEKGLRASAEDPMPTGSPEELTCTIAITFANPGPDQRREVPPFG
ncbi:hypothetical protein [Aestuariispira insulae]|nr:hypothetical protein [Aestuariispira insulae]